MKAPFKLTSFSASTLIFPFPWIPALLEIIWFPLSSYPIPDSILTSFPALRFISPSPFTVPPCILILFFASRDISPPAAIPPLNPPVALFIISFSDLMLTFPPPIIFPLELTTFSASIFISPSTLILEPAPPPLSLSAILILVSFPKYTCGTRTISPSTSISTYQIISFSNLFICSGVNGIPSTNPKSLLTNAPLSNKDFTLSLVISPAYPKPSLILLSISSFS